MESLDPERQRLWVTAMRPLVLYRLLHNQEHSAMRFRRLVGEAETRGDAQSRKTLGAQHSAALRDYRDTYEQIRQEGLLPPPIPPDVASDLEHHNMEVY